MYFYVANIIRNEKVGGSIPLSGTTPIIRLKLFPNKPGRQIRYRSSTGGIAVPHDCATSPPPTSPQIPCALVTSEVD